MGLKLPCFRSKQSPPHLRFPGPPTLPPHLELGPPIVPPHHPERVQTLQRDRKPFPSSTRYTENEVLPTDSLYGSSLEIPWTSQGYHYTSQTKPVNNQTKPVNIQTFTPGRNPTEPPGSRNWQNNKYLSIKGIGEIEFILHVFCINFWEFMHFWYF